MMRNKVCELFGWLGTCSILTDVFIVTIDAVAMIISTAFVLISLANASYTFWKNLKEFLSNRRNSHKP